MAKAKRKKSTKGKKGNDEHGKKDVSANLASLDEIWGDVDPIEFGEVSDGKYQVQIKNITLNEAKSSGRFQCSWELKIVSGEYANRSMFKHDGLDNAESLGYFKGGLARLGVECPDDSAELPEVLESLMGTFCVITARTKKGSDIQNIFFTKALDDDEVEETEVEEIEDVEEDVEEEIEEVDGDDVEEDVEEDEEIIWEKGERCGVEINGEVYEGKIVSIKDDVAKINFDDGDKDSYPTSDLIIVEEAEEEDNEETEAQITLKFDEEKISDKQQREIEDISKTHDFDPDDYESYSDLLMDVAEYLGVSGEFSSPATLIKAIKTV